MDDRSSDDERLILDWLLDRNKIHRDVRKTPAENKVAEEIDVSGGLAALLRVLRSGGPIDPEIAAELAEALDPFGDSIFHIAKRSRRRRGRPRKDEASDVFETMRLGVSANAAILKNEKAGKGRQRDLITGDVAADKKTSKAKIYGARKLVGRARR